MITEIVVRAGRKTYRFKAPQQAEDVNLYFESGVLAITHSKHGTVMVFAPGSWDNVSRVWDDKIVV